MLKKFKGLGHIFDDVCKKYPNKIAVEMGSQTLTFQDLNNYINKFAHFLIQKGLKKGDIVGLICKNRPEYLIIEFAMYKLGIIPMKISWRSNEKEVSSITSIKDAKMIIIDKEVNNDIFNIIEKYDDKMFLILENIDDSTTNLYDLINNESNEEINVEFNHEDIAFHTCTSGTTGRAKAVTISHFSAVEKTQIMSDVFYLNSDDICLSIYQFFHSASIGIWTSLIRGSKVIVFKDYSTSKVVDAMIQQKVNMLMIVPTALKMIVQECKKRNYDLDYVNSIKVGGAPLFKNLVEDILSKNNKIIFYNFYGMSEMDSAISLLDSNLSLKYKSVGKALKDHEIIIVNDKYQLLKNNQIGEILVKGPGMMLGYYKEDELTKSKFYKGYYCTGDLGYLDDEGYLYLAGRNDDLIISGGENIYPAEVENIMIEIEGIREVAVVGVSDDIWGQHPCAFVSLDEGYSYTEEELINICRDKIQHYKCPKEIIFKESLKKNGAGKIDKKELIASLVK